MDITTRQDLDKIMEIYEENHPQGTHHVVGDAVWVPTPTDILIQELAAFDALIAKERKRHEGNVLIAGAGDGRRGAPLSRLGYNVVAVELIPEYAHRGISIRDKLVEQRLVDPSKFKMAKGNFLSDGTYDTEGLSFTDFGKIFAYLKSEHINGLGDKIKKQSPVGTELFLLLFMQDVQPQIGLDYVGEFKVRNKNSLQGYYNVHRYRKNI